MISFFVKRAFLNTSPGKPFEYQGFKPKVGHLQRVSSMIRADQIAEYLNARLNPTDNFKDDLCIYVKPSNDITFEKRSYLDICDSPTLFELARQNPKVGVIVASEWNKELCERILPNKIVLIPQQHCNFERQKRNRKGIKKIGCIGSRKAFDHLPVGLKEELSKRGIELVTFADFYCRKDVVDFYLNIDLQIIWRPYTDYSKDILMNSLKIQNSASFGIPTIAYDEPVFKEMGGCYIGVKSLNEFLAEVDNLIKYPSFYQDLSENCLEKAENYHIENIAKLYKKLDE